MMPKSLWMHQGASLTGLTYTGEDGHGKDNLSSGPGGFALSLSLFSPLSLTLRCLQTWP